MLKSGALTEAIARTFPSRTCSLFIFIYLLHVEVEHSRARTVTIRPVVSMANKPADVVLFLEKNIIPYLISRSDKFKRIRCWGNDLSRCQLWVCLVPKIFWE
jgi:hypothetical protein